MKHPDIVIIKPGSQKKLYGELSAFALTAIEPPLWTALLGAFLREQGYGVELLDAEAMGWDAGRSAEEIRARNPRLAVVSVSGSNPSASTMNMIGAGLILEHLRRIAPEIPSALHGLHPSALPERTLREEACDFVCQGEGFSTFPALLDALAAGEEPNRVPGLWHRREGRILSTPAAALVKDLDSLPLPAWDLLPMDRYRAHNWHCFDHIERRQPYGVIYTSLGCPFSCTFCCINALFGKPGYRQRSPERVVQEIDLMVERYGVRNIKIIDELFAVNEERIVRLCELISSRGHDLNIWAYARVNTVTPRMLAAMKAAGINWIAYGFESASERVLRAANKKYDPASVHRVVEMTADAGLYIGANFMFGLPEDDYDSMQQTLALAQELNAEWANFFTTKAYPGSALYDEALQNGWALPERWEDYSEYSFGSLPLPSRHLSAGEILSFRDYAFHAYFENPRYLNKIKDTFGTATVEHIRSMTAHKLERRHAAFPHHEHREQNHD